MTMCSSSPSSPKVGMAAWKCFPTMTSQKPSNSYSRSTQLLHHLQKKQHPETRRSPLLHRRVMVPVARTPLMSRLMRLLSSRQRCAGNAWKRCQMSHHNHHNWLSAWPIEVAYWCLVVYLLKLMCTDIPYPKIDHDSLVPSISFSSMF